MWTNKGCGRFMKCLFYQRRSKKFKILSINSEKFHHLGCSTTPKFWSSAYGHPKDFAFATPLFTYQVLLIKIVKRLEEGLKKSKILSTWFLNNPLSLGEPELCIAQGYHGHFLNRFIWKMFLTSSNFIFTRYFKYMVSIFILQ